MSGSLKGSTSIKIRAACYTKKRIDVLMRRQLAVLGFIASQEQAR